MTNDRASRRSRMRRRPSPPASAVVERNPQVSQPPFLAALGLANGSLQTLVPYFWGGRAHLPQPRQHQVTLADGDQIVLHENEAQYPMSGQPAALLIHGLGGCHASPYVTRISQLFTQHGIRVFRMDQRGCGAGALLAKNPYHAGRSDDLAAVIEYLGAQLPDRELTVIGFSLGGNVVLKYAGEAGPNTPPHLARVAAVSPPVDLAYGSQQLKYFPGRAFDLFMTRQLWKQALLRLKQVPGATQPKGSRTPRSLKEFDERYTILFAGYESADAYYEASASKHVISNIALPALILAAEDDPIVPSKPYEELKLAPLTKLVITQNGGHLGFLARRGQDRTRRWLDWRLLEWVQTGLQAGFPGQQAMLKKQPAGSPPAG